MNTPGRLQDLVAVITGGGSGFGESMAHAFAKAGAKVVVADLNADAGARVAADLNPAGSSAISVRVGVSKSNDMRDLIKAAFDRFGQIDIMVNNAGISHPNGPMLNVTEEFFDRLCAVNVKSIYLSAVHCVPVFRKQKRGRFINIGSTAAVRPRPGLTGYNGSKGAVILITKSMAGELAPDNIRVNAINPAIADTPLLITFMGGGRHEGKPRAFSLRFHSVASAKPQTWRTPRSSWPNRDRVSSRVWVSRSTVVDAFESAAISDMMKSGPHRSRMRQKFIPPARS